MAETGGTIDALAVTMTGELADCFVDRAEGVQHIVSHLCKAADRLGIHRIAFYSVDGRFLSANAAREHVDLVAAANWHALASFVAQQVAPNATLIDIGSTTADIIPIADGRVDTTAQTDHQRLHEGSLVYVGCRRTPVCALVNDLKFRNRRCSVMNELFATIDDALLVLGHVDENADDRDTADGMPRTGALASNRLARMIGLDRRTVSLAESRDLAKQVLGAARQRIADALERMVPQPIIVLSGHGQVLIDLPDGPTVLRLSDVLGTQTARCAPSFAIASLYAKQSEASAGCDA